MGVSHPPFHEIPDNAFAAEAHILHITGALDDRFNDLSGPRRIPSIAWWFCTGGCSVQVLMNRYRIQSMVIRCIERRTQGPRFDG